MFLLPTKAQKQAKKCKGLIVICKRRQRFAYPKDQCCDPLAYACQRPHTGFLLAITIKYHYVSLDHYESQWVEQLALKP